MGDMQEGQPGMSHLMGACCRQRSEVQAVVECVMFAEGVQV